MSRLLKDARKVNAANEVKPPPPARIKDWDDEGFDLLDEDSETKPVPPVQKKGGGTIDEKKDRGVNNGQGRVTWVGESVGAQEREKEKDGGVRGGPRPVAPVTWQDRVAESTDPMNQYQSVQFSKDFERELKHMTTVRIPDVIDTFIQYDQHKESSLEDMKVDMMLEMNRLNGETQRAFMELRTVESKIDESVNLKRDKASIVGLLFDRKDLQKKTELLCYKKMALDSAIDGLEEFKMLSELSRDMKAFSSVCKDYFTNQKLYIDVDDDGQEQKMSLAYSNLYKHTDGFTFDKDPLHDYMLIDTSPESSDILKLQVEKEYRLLTGGVSPLESFPN